MLAFRHRREKFSLFVKVLQQRNSFFNSVNVILRIQFFISHITRFYLTIENNA